MLTHPSKKRMDVYAAFAQQLPVASHYGVMVKKPSGRTEPRGERRGYGKVSPVPQLDDADALLHQLAVR